MDWPDVDYYIIKYLKVYFSQLLELYLNKKELCTSTSTSFNQINIYIFGCTHHVFGCTTTCIYPGHRQLKK